MRVTASFLARWRQWTSTRVTVDLPDHGKVLLAVQWNAIKVVGKRADWKSGLPSKRSFSVGPLHASTSKAVWVSTSHDRARPRLLGRRKFFLQRPDAVEYPRFSSIMGKGDRSRRTEEPVNPEVPLARYLASTGACGNSLIAPCGRMWHGRRRGAARCGQCGILLRFPAHVLRR